MQNSYSQWNAFKALTWASLKALLKSPSTVAFTLGFPLIFILVFNYIDFNGSNKISIAITPEETESTLLNALRENPNFKIININNVHSGDSLIQAGEAKAYIYFHKKKDKINATVNHGELTEQELYSIKTTVKDIVLNQNDDLKETINTLTDISTNQTVIIPFQTIDFILPGQLGFALLASGIFSTAFVFYNLRQSLVLKRFFATPVKKSTIILAECTSRLVFQLAAAILILSIGYFFLDYHLNSGLMTFFNMLIICTIAIFAFLSYGFIVSSIAKNESVIPPLANLLTLPQFLLAGTFFSINHFPNWLQTISKTLPLTHFNNAARKIAFEGASLWSVKLEIAIIIFWGIVGFIIAVKVFKWE